MKTFSMILFVACSLVVAGLLSTSAEEGDAAAGKTQFETYCVACHGAEGKGDGVAAAALDPKPRDLSNAEFVSTVSNEHIFKVIKEGGASVGLSPLMSAWGGALSDQQIWDVIAYIRQDLCKCEYKAK